ncbi:MAG: phosphoribosylglycinamide formyltransferase, partial [Halobacteriovoraceae bacterium]|nr:phosphoribosylglycinamide formyltransferase [Halobacteriovoraceae bacterium]
MAYKITVCASGGGGNFQALIDNQQDNGYEINLLISDRQCKAIERATKHQIPYKIIKKNQSDSTLFTNMDQVIPHDTNLIILAGFFPILNTWFCDKWENKIINTHPSLLPNYGGKGMYGIKVQEA